MDFENEITVEVDLDLNDLVKKLEDDGFKLIESYDLNDIYLINQDDRHGDYLEMLSKCVLIRNFIIGDKEKKMLTYKYKEYNENKEIIKQGKINVNIDDVNNAKLLLESLNFEELIRINDHLLIYATDNDEFAVQFVNKKHVYLEIEDKCTHIDKEYKSVDEMKSVIEKYSIPMKNNNYFVKKAEIELQEKYSNK